MDFQTLTLTIDNDGVAWVTLDRPDRRNAFNARMRAEIPAALDRAAEMARAIVLTGAGESFCAGQDLGDGALEGLEIERVLREEYEPMLRAVLDSPVPVLAAVNGAAAGAGANLALAADVVIAAERAVFVQAFTRIGLIPDAGGTYWLPRKIGVARAMGAMLFAEPIPARQAADWGMIWEAVPDEAFSDRVTARARQLAAGPTVAFRALKQAVRDGTANDLDAQLALEARLQGVCGATRDFKEGVLAFLEKRPPEFEGR